MRCACWGIDLVPTDPAVQAASRRRSCIAHRRCPEALRPDGVQEAWVVWPYKVDLVARAFDHGVNEDLPP